MRQMDQKIRRVIENLSFQSLSFRNRHTPAVYGLLQELLQHFAWLEKQGGEEGEHLQISYDLLLVYASKIERVQQRKDWTVDQLLLLLDQLYALPLLPARVKNDHPLRRGMIIHQYLSWSQLFELAKLAYGRLKSFFSLDFPLTLGRRIKFTLGNVFAGHTNIKILIDIHPHVTQLMLPMDPLKKEYDAFLNELITELLSYPKLNQETSLLTINDAYAKLRPMFFDFSEVMKLLNYLSDADLRDATGETYESVDVKAVQSKVILMRQMQEFLFSGNPSRMQEALHARPALRNCFANIFNPLTNLRPIYTWGSVLDEQFNLLLEEVKGFSFQMQKALKPGPPIRAPEPHSWNIPWKVMVFWKGMGRAISSALEMAKQVFTSLLPSIYKITRFLMPSDKLSSLIEKCKEPVDKMLQHGLSLGKSFESLGVYHETSQKVLAPLRSTLLGVKLEPLQRIICLYKNQFERFLDDPNNALALWHGLDENQKKEVLLNAAMLFHQLNAHLNSLFPLITPDKVRAVREAFEETSSLKTDFDGLIIGMMQLQKILQGNTDGLMQTVMDIFNTQGDALTMGSATHSVMRDATGSSVVGSMVGGVMDAIPAYRLSLSFIPSEMGLAHLPDSWKDKKMKWILKEEIKESFNLLDQFKALNYNQVFAPSHCNSALVC